MKKKLDADNKPWDNPRNKRKTQKKIRHLLIALYLEWRKLKEKIKNYVKK